MTVVKDNVRVWSDMESMVFWAPKGTPLPETLTESLHSAFEPIGALNEDGPSEGVSVDVNKIKGWPGGQTLRIKTTATEKTFSFTALEEKPVVTRIFYNHGAVTVSGSGVDKVARYDIPESFGTVEGALVAVFRDGDYKKARCMELVQVSERGDVSNGNEDPAGYELTVDNIGKDYVLTNQPAFVGEAPSKTEWTVEVTGTPTGGTFVLNVDGFNTSPIAFDAAAAAVQTALNGLSGVTGVTATVTGTATKAVTFSAGATLTGDGSGLTGGTAPAVAVA